VKKCALFLGVLLLGYNASAQQVEHTSSSENLLQMSLEDLTQIHVGSVANRYQTQDSKSAASVSVITAQEIARHGYKTLQELLDRVVGFDTAYHIFRPLVSNRGFRQDVNSNYLLLVDGHRINENSGFGFGVLQIYPMIDNIAKVEIIRGPSSTLWGGSALNGIISITTKQAKDYSGSDRESGSFEGSVDYEIEDKRGIINATYAKSSKDYGFVFSALYFDSDSDYTRLYAYGNTDATPYPNYQANYNFYPSYKIYSSLRYKDMKINLSHTRYKHSDNMDISQKYDTEGYRKIQNDWIELIYTPKLTDTISLESRVFYDYKYDTLTKIYQDIGSDEEQRYKDEGVGGEVILHQDTDSYHLLGGVFAQSMALDSKMDGYYNQHANDKIVAAFAEINYMGFEDWIFTLGARVEYGEPRGDRHTFMPRFMLYRAITENGYIKYMYNTGSLRPTLLTSRGYTYTASDSKEYYAQGAQKSQTSSSHSIETGYKLNNIKLTATFFYNNIKNLVLWGDRALAGTKDGVPVQLWETNLVDITQKGIELQANWHISKEINFYANYSYADTKYDDEWVEYEGKKLFSLVDYLYTDDSKVMAGAPQQVWNVGYDWDVFTHISWNFNYHGRYGVLSIYPNSSWKKFGFEHFFDTNIRCVDLFAKNLEIDLYMKNITNNDGRFPTGYGEVQTQIARQSGLKLKYAF